MSPNAGPSNFAGKECNRNYYVVSWQNDSLHESAGQNATNLGYKKAFILAPNYQAGKDALDGLQALSSRARSLGEIYTSSIRPISPPKWRRSALRSPDVVFQFHPGGLGIAFMRQYQQSGLLEPIPMVVASPSMDAATLAGGRRCSARRQSHGPMEHGLRHARQQGFRRGVVQRSTIACRPIMPAGLRHGARDRRRA